ncbi:MAG: alanine dehydrogenase [Parachlamydiaceae bacterium]
MKIGIPKEIKVKEYRVGATPAMVHTLVGYGHQVLVETHAGAMIHFSDDDYRAAGATIVAGPEKVYEADMIVKVKEPQQSEFSLLREGQILFCFLHLAPDPIQTKQLIEKKVVGIACDTVTDAMGRLPLLTPMSEIAGRLSIQVGGTALQLDKGGKGILLGGVPGVAPAKVVVIGGGASGTEAARMAMGAGAQVIIFDKNLARLRELDHLYGPMLQTLYSTPSAIGEAVAEADLVIGAVLIPGKIAPKVVTREMVARMQPGSVIVDISIDQGGCVETALPTTHDDPTFVVNGVIHYCVTNMPGVCARTATLAFTQATMDYVVAIANKGYVAALRDDPFLRKGLNVCAGHVTNANVAHDLNYPYVPAESLL